MNNKTIPSSVAAVVLVMAVWGIAAFELSALQAQERRSHPAGAQTRASCLKCHSGPQWIARIAAKEGKKATDPLFVDDVASPAKGLTAGGKCPIADTGNANNTTYNGK